MLLSQFIALLSSRNAIFIESRLLMELLSSHNRIWIDYENKLISMSEPTSATAAYLIEAMDAAREILASLSYRNLFREIDALQEFLLQGAKEEQDESEQNISSLLAVLSDGLDSYARRPGRAAALLVLVRARDLYGKVVVFSQINTELIALLATSEVRSEAGEGELSIFFPSASAYKSVLACLQALYNIYCEYCELLRVSTAEHPIRIGKIESGSLWVRVLGEPDVLKFISSSLKAVASFAYRNYTAEGRIESIPKKLEVIEGLLKLSDELRRRGIDDAQMSDELERAAVALARHFNCLIEGQKSICINGEDISPKSELERALSGDADKPRLPGVASKRLNPPQE